MKHWTENDFLQWIYGLKDDSSHLDGCPSCRNRATVIRDRRRITVESVAREEVSFDFLAAQRGKIYQRLEGGVHRVLPKKLAFSFAGAALVIALCIGLLLPAKRSVPTYTKSDEQFFSDIISLDQNSEPKAIQPIHRLFEE